GHVMRITLVTPASRQAGGGNRTTAVRWTRILRKLGHRVRLALDYAGEPADALIALHAWRSAKWIEKFHAQHPERPIIVALTGTDIYRFLHSHRKTTLHSLDLATRLIGLHALVGEAIPQRYHGKLRIIYQSAAPLRPVIQSSRAFDVLVIGHLRGEKDPL